MTKKATPATADVATTPMPPRPPQLNAPEEIVAYLETHTTPLEAIEVRDGRGGQKWHYLRHQFVTQTLNELTGHNWDFHVERERIDEDCISVLGRLTLRIGEHRIVKMQWGSADVKRKNADGTPLSIGDDFKAATSDALKKCATLLGLGLDLTQPVRPEVLKALHTAGSTKFGAEAWNTGRAKAIRTLTGGRATSSKELTDVEARILIEVINGQGSQAEVVREAYRLLTPKQKGA